jgi:hypothetical protein
MYAPASLVTSVGLPVPSAYWRPNECAAKSRGCGLKRAGLQCMVAPGCVPGAHTTCDISNK